MSEFDRLRQLLLAEERESLVRADARLVELERSRADLAGELPGLVRAAPSQAMADALSAPVASALGNAVRHNSSSIVDALFPVIGPLIRKAIAEALRGLMSDLNGVLEQSLTPRGIKWRLEAWRCGLPYAQVVLRHNLRYRIDHVFLIERDSGLVLDRRSSPGLPDLDADAIAGMLTAIGQFVRDSVGREHGALEEARVGEYLLWLLDGPRASIACFIHGVPPDALRALLDERLEQVHARLGSAEPADHGIVAAASLDPAELSRLAVAGSEERAAPSRWPLLIVLLAVLAGLAWYIARAERWDQRVDSVRAALAAHPGFVLTGIDSTAWRTLRVHGLVDADAEPLAPLVAGTDLGGVEPQWQLERHVSGDDPIVLMRARRLLAPPATVDLDVEEGILRLAGTAPESWVAEARQRAGWVPGVRGVAFGVTGEGASAVAPETARASPANAAAAAELDALADRIGGLHVGFVHAVEPDAAAAEHLRAIVAALGRAEALAADAGLRLRIEAVGFNDPSGSDEVNAALRRARAGWLVDALAAHGIVAEVAATPHARDDAASGPIHVRGAGLRLVRETTTR